MRNQKYAFQYFAYLAGISFLTFASSGWFSSQMWSLVLVITKVLFCQLRYMMCWCYASIKHPMFSQEENWCLGRHKNIFLAVKVQYLLTLFFVKCLMLNKSLWNNIIKNFAWMNTGAFNIIFRKSSLKVILEIGIFSEFILQNYFVKYLDTSIVHF